MPTAESLAFKDHEDDASQLNRLGVAYFLIVYFQFQPPYIGFAFFFVPEAEPTLLNQLLLNQLRLGISKASAHSCQRVSSLRPSSGGRRRNVAFAPAQILAGG